MLIHPPGGKREGLMSQHIQKQLPHKHIPKANNKTGHIRLNFQPRKHQQIIHSPEALVQVDH